MKKLFAMLIVSLMVLSMVPLAFAENTTANDTAVDTVVDDSVDAVNDSVTDDVNATDSDGDSDDNDSGEESDEDLEEELEEEISEEDEAVGLDAETQDEVDEMNNVHGAEMRLLQLQESIERKVLEASSVLEILETNGASVPELDAILAELDALNDEVAALDPAADNAVRAFVDAKKSARDLINEFKKIARPLLTEKNIAALKEKFKQVRSDKLDDFKERADKKRKDFNKLRLSELEGDLGEDLASLRAKLAAGKITVGELKKELNDLFKKLNSESKAAALGKLKAAKTKRKVFKLSKVSEVKEKHKERFDKKEKKRKEKAKDRKKIRKEIKKRAKFDREEKEDRLEIRTEHREERVKNGERVKIRERSELKIDLDDDDSGSDSDGDDNSDSDDSDDAAGSDSALV